MANLSAKEKLELTRQACEADLETFINTLAPHRVLGHVHSDLIRWWDRQGAKENQLVLLPRAHQKSALIAYRVAWYLTKNPSATILYISATSALAEAQLKAIKDILNSDKYRLLWPEMTHPDEGKRSRWTNEEIIVDHPKYKEEGVRDASIKAAGLTTTITGFHADLVVIDDAVEPNNAYTKEGRAKVASQYSQLASIENPGAKEWVVGTRYHPSDLYGTLLDMVETEYDEDDEVVREEPVYECFLRVVQTDGEFLWPRQRRKDGKYFGFNHGVLARLKAKYVDQTQFYAQYYNDPNDPENQRVDRDDFQYYDKEQLKYKNNSWEIAGRKLNVVAAIDFAFSTKTKADYSVVAVIGMDFEGYYYILDLTRFKTDKISVYYKHILAAYNKWNFRKIRMEVSVAQKAVVQDLKINYIQRQGLALVIDEFRPSKHDGTKEERINATLTPRYENKQIFHYRGGNCQLLEEEIVATKPEHDDLSDAVTAAIDILTAPPRATHRRTNEGNIVYDSRFGGVGYRK